MPRGRAKRGGARGGSRGRGRGSSVAADDAEIKIEPSAEDNEIDDTEPVEEDEPDSNTVEGISTQPEAEANTMIVTNDFPSAQPEPPSSPASIPTETPAPTPNRAPVQRLATLSLSKPNPSPSARGTTSRGRFKPRPIRRDKDERERAEKEEQARMSARDQEVHAANGSFGGRGGRGRAGAIGRALRGRGRGDAMGRGRLTASGLFGVAPAAEPRPKPGSTLANNNSKTTGDEREQRKTTATSVSKTATTNGSAPISIMKKESSDLQIKHNNEIYAEEMEVDGEHVNDEPPEPVYPWDNDDGKKARRLHWNDIGNRSDSDDQILDSRAKGKSRVSSKPASLRPIGLASREHKKRAPIVILDTDEEDQGYVKPQSTIREKSASAGQRSAPSGTKNDGKISSHGAESGNQPERMDWTSTGLPPIPGPAPSPKIKRLHPSSEEFSERMRIDIDAKVLAKELHDLNSSSVHLSGETAHQDLSEAGRLYIFQFPPTLPPLLNAKKIKIEHDEMEITDVRKLPEAGVGGQATTPSPDDAIEVKEDPDGPAPKVPDLLDEEGFIGKLVVRESGKVELDWGGTSLQLGRGAEFDFLTTTMIIKDDVGTSMGPISGKFIATPDWSKMFNMD